MTTEVERSISATQLLLILASNAAATDLGSVDSVLDDADEFATRSLDHPDARRLLGVIAGMRGEDEKAIEWFESAVASGDGSALPGLQRALSQAGRHSAAESVGDQLDRAIDEGRADAAWGKGRDIAMGLSSGGEAEAFELMARAAELGWSDAQVWRSELALSHGVPGAFATLLELAETLPSAARVAGRHSWPFLHRHMDFQPEPTSPASLLRSAHERGDLRATLFLWLRSDAPDDREFRETLDEWRIGEERRSALVWLGENGPGYALAEHGDLARDSGEELFALRLWQMAATLGCPDVVPVLGEMLREEAGNEGAWAVFGAFLAQWPGLIQDDRVGSVEYPLAVGERLPALRDDHSNALPVASSDFAKRIHEVLEQVNWQMERLGDHLLVGHWSTESGPVQIYVEISGGLAADRMAYFSTPLLVGLGSGHSPPWSAPPSTPPADAPALMEDLLEAHRAGEFTRLDACADSFDSIQRRALEALLRVGENDSRETYLEPMGMMGMSLGGMLGRVMTFTSVPEDLYPQAWVSVSNSDYFSTRSIEIEPESHRFARAQPVLDIGYTVSAEASGGHLKGLLVGVVGSLITVQDYLTRMFDQEPTIFEEFFHAVPTLRLLDNAKEFPGAFASLPQQRDELATARDLLTREFDEYREILRDPHADPATVNNVAFQLLKAGHEDEAIEGLTRAASAGQPNALATLTWQYMLRDDPGSAVQVFEEFSARVDPWLNSPDLDADVVAEMREQVPNFQSNAALAYLATGDRGTALSLWIRAGAKGHREARVYPAVLLAADGDAQAAAALLEDVSFEDLEAVSADMREVLRDGRGWFVRWAQDCLDLLGRQ